MNSSLYKIFKFSNFYLYCFFYFSISLNQTGLKEEGLPYCHFAFCFVFGLYLSQLLMKKTKFLS